MPTLPNTPRPPIRGSQVNHNHLFRFSHPEDTEDSKCDPPGLHPFTDGSIFTSGVTFSTNKFAGTFGAYSPPIAFSPSASETGVNPPPTYILAQMLHDELSVTCALPSEAVIKKRPSREMEGVLIVKRLSSSLGYSAAAAFSPALGGGKGAVVREEDEEGVEDEDRRDIGILPASLTRSTSETRQQRPTLSTAKSYLHHLHPLKDVAHHAAARRRSQPAFQDPRATWYSYPQLMTNVGGHSYDNRYHEVDHEEIRRWTRAHDGLGWCDGEVEVAPSVLTHQLSALALRRVASKGSLRSASEGGGGLKGMDVSAGASITRQAQPSRCQHLRWRARRQLYRMACRLRGRIRHLGHRDGEYPSGS
ncbi:hypothetical protein BD410DRAFT_806609 [Rickenella mellea]|uniref:Uncharacterized protein n=1 Tax=Rickenella mellea TaxID=50990 RepID=A0A4Y7PTA4_9AGAM|nr:hypothetical protein BD410DRAFT_806609 [Rickenella mellea]